MSKFRSVIIVLAAISPWAADAAVEAGTLPANTVWYLHADLAAMRASDAGSKVYAWFEDEVVVDVKEEIGIDISSEVNTLTAFANGKDGTVIIVDGPIRQESRDKMLALAALEGPVDPREHKGLSYYFFGDSEEEESSPREPLQDLQESVYVSFAVKGKAIVTGNEMQMQELLERGGRLSGSGSHDGALLVLSANRALVQAGLQPGGLMEAGDDDDWESNIVRNTKEAALLLADESGQLALEAQLVSSDPKMAEAIGGIANGLISLQAFNSDLGPELQSLIRNTKVQIVENVLSISVVIDPELVVKALAD